MLKLSSNYAKSYIRDTTPQQPERNRPKGADRLYPGGSELDFDLPKKSMLQDNESRRERYDYKQPSTADFKNEFALPNEGKITKEKPYAFARNDDYRQDFGEYQRKARNYDEPLTDLDSNYRDKSPRTYNAKRNNSPVASYEFDLPSQNEQNYEPDSRTSKYSKYSARGNPLETNFGLDKKDYTVKHTKRNEQVKNRIMKEQNYPKDPYSKNYYEQKQLNTYDNYLNEGGQPYDNFRNQQEDYRQPSPYVNSRRLQFQTFDKPQDWKTDRTPRGNVESSPYSQYPQTKQKGDDFNYERFDRPSLNERKQSIKKSIEGTPQKSYKGKFEPGSAERKNSLIEKSQMLQEKLKKLNMQYPAGQRQKDFNNSEQQTYQPQRPVSRNQFPQQNEEMYSRYTPSPHIQSSISNRSSSCLKNNFRNISIGQVQRDATPSIRNFDNIRTKSPIHDAQGQAQPPMKGEAIEKITKLNQKINERIQSIISNYARK